MRSTLRMRAELGVEVRLLRESVSLNITRGVAWQPVRALCAGGSRRMRSHSALSGGVDVHLRLDDRDQPEADDVLSDLELLLDHALDALGGWRSG